MAGPRVALGVTEWNDNGEPVRIAPWAGEVALASGVLEVGHDAGAQDQHLAVTRFDLALALQGRHDLPPRRRVPGWGEVVLHACELDQLGWPGCGARGKPRHLSHPLHAAGAVLTRVNPPNFNVAHRSPRQCCPA